MSLFVINIRTNNEYIVSWSDTIFSLSDCIFFSSFFPVRYWINSECSKGGEDLKTFAPKNNDDNNVLLNETNIFFPIDASVFLAKIGRSIFGLVVVY